MDSTKIYNSKNITCHYNQEIGFPTLYGVMKLVRAALFLPPLFKTTEGVVVLFQIFACGPELPIE